MDAERSLVVYQSSQTLKRVKLGDSHPEQLLSTKGFPQYFVPEFGPSTDNMPDDSRMFLKMSARWIFTHSM